ncbi:MAG: hypothetical protein KKE11_06700 [Gammaproteobacteria bacterium]|nr:hypothetical protein [Gammaproteobacteria bacterium]
MITELKAADVLVVHGGKCMFCKWLNDNVGKPVFEEALGEVVDMALYLAEEVAKGIPKLILSA